MDLFYWQILGGFLAFALGLGFPLKDCWKIYRDAHVGPFFLGLNLLLFYALFHIPMDMRSYLAVAWSILFSLRFPSFIVPTSEQSPMMAPKMAPTVAQSVTATSILFFPFLVSFLAPLQGLFFVTTTTSFRAEVVLFAIESVVLLAVMGMMLLALSRAKELSKNQRFLILAFFFPLFYILHALDVPFYALALLSAQLVSGLWDLPKKILYWFYLSVSLVLVSFLFYELDVSLLIENSEGISLTLGTFFLASLIFNFCFFLKKPFKWKSVLVSALRYTGPGPLFLPCLIIFRQRHLVNLFEWQVFCWYAFFFVLLFSIIGIKNYAKYSRP